MNVEDMYQQIILDHYREKHHSGLRDGYAAEVTQVNPSCGDELMLRLHLDGDVITDVSYDAVGCSISQASTSVMTDLVIGGTVDHAQKLYRGFQAMMRSHGEETLDPDRYDDAVAFEGVAKLMARVKCAMLGWSALEEAMMEAQQNSDTAVSTQSSDTAVSTQNSSTAVCAGAPARGEKA
ncbi:Fe-S cluster assembly sulfur transfer protein SufU [Acidipropionibacterium jensenii]|uniref:NifU-like protein n=2 Tax=Acidipropionibacterium jensenii TaxID=1749 RepID=A0A448P2C1_9ACTN|nr:SUF system NifU family Fe-S cluster assembly protein [Acidipropionibacterium jensenii]AZZ39128.1 SUF system NifU family Fe-S cluster assembly protein [Acidipropionibacterium jensenii]MDN6442473.1 SUF system NifU family Fe-S cluster assembly protein [Acidipropionibacterium jensenii]MDN6481086.1 SUF system NifU family Fe-S cluster assembly protein [Acidipropionibacterium jensenii]MDN6512134.1 SUF system NifU family Fe-S cluster assembly protein [Acidipropionibacterium jensenii]MDN6591681.1 SU